MPLTFAFTSALLASYSFSTSFHPLRSDVHRSDTRTARQIHVGAIRQQQFENFQMTECDGKHQRRIAIVIDRVDVCASSQQ